MLESDEFYNTPIRPVTEDEWPYECIAKHGSVWIIGKPNPKLEIKNWLEQQARIDPQFEWIHFRAKDYPERPPVGNSFRISKTVVGQFYYFKRPQDAMLFKLAWG